MCNNTTCCGTLYACLQGTRHYSKVLVISVALILPQKGIQCNTKEIQATFKIKVVPYTFFVFLAL
jgi:hypothetical protein